MSTARYLIGDVRDVLRTIPDGSVDLIVSSPPFLALRSYLPPGHESKHAEIGSEANPAEFLRTLLDLTVEWRRVLAPHGSIAIELGDTFAGSGGAGGDYAKGGLREGQEAFDGSARRKWTPPVDGRNTGVYKETTPGYGDRFKGGGPGGVGWPLAKSLCGIPTLYTWSLAYGRNLLDPSQTFEPWRIRNLLVWARPNPPVGALGDKWRPATSYITVACTGPRRFFDLDAVRTEHVVPLADRKNNKSYKRSDASRGGGGDTTRDHYLSMGNPAGAPPLDWWSDSDDGPNGDRLWVMPTQPYAGSHFATFPPELPRRIIECMCPQRVCRTCGKPSERITSTEYEPHGARRDENKGVRGGAGASGEHAQHMAHGRASKIVDTLGWTDCGHDDWRTGIVLDPFGGSGTTGAVATGLGRDCILVDIDERNVDLARERVGMFLEVEDTREAAA